MFQGRNLLIVTKHEKEKVIAPILEKELGVNCCVSATFDTDLLGTFTGEIERIDDPLTTVRNKCLLAMSANDCDLAVANEGSFGPHPTLFFAHADDELILLIDKKNDLEIVARHLSTETNYNQVEVRNVAELNAFAHQAQFPSHALILRNDKNSSEYIVKGITDWQTLHTVFNEMITNFGKVYVETDMRAMFNPTRMKMIEKATEKLVATIQSVCPNCATPGFSITATIPGLPCSMCGYPTKSTLSYKFVCQKCQFVREEKYPNNTYTEDPMYCDRCNP